MKKTKLKTERVSLPEVFSDVLFNIKTSIEKTNAIVNIPFDDYFIQGNKGQLLQLFQNFIGNAIKYQPKENIPQVDVTINSIGENYLISIEDNGIGMDKKYLNTIFEPFQRLHGNSEYQGSGVGLSICLSVLENHNGIITVESEVGKGSSFVFTLPKAKDKTLA